LQNFRIEIFLNVFFLGRERGDSRA